MKRILFIILCMALLGSLFITAFGEAVDARQIYVRVPSSWKTVSLCPLGANNETLNQPRTALTLAEDRYIATIPGDLTGFTLHGSNGEASKQVSVPPVHDLYVTVDTNGDVQVNCNGFEEPAATLEPDMDATVGASDPVQTSGNSVDATTATSAPEVDVTVADGTEKENTVVSEEVPVTTAPAQREYCLVGYINGKDYGFEKDYLNIGEYIFDNGTLTTTFSADSYIFVKTTDNQHWFLTTSYCTDTSAIFIENSWEKMFVPGNVEVTFTLEELDATRISLSYKPTKDVTNATDPTDPNEPVYSRSLVIKPPETWNQVYIYTWEPESYGKFPGMPVEKVGDDYAVIIESTVKNLVLSNGQYSASPSVSSGKNLQTDDIFLLNNGKDIAIEIQKDHSFTVTYQGDKSARRPAAPATEGLPSSYRVSGNSEWLGDWEADTELGVMTTITEGTYRKNFENVPAGKYELMITNNGTWEDSYGHTDGKNFVIEMDYPSNVTIEFKIDDGTASIDAYGYGIADTSNSGASTSSSGPTYSLTPDLSPSPGSSFSGTSLFPFCLLAVCIYLVYLITLRKPVFGHITPEGKVLRRKHLSQKDVESAVKQNMPAPSSKLDQSVMDAIHKAKQTPTDS